MTDVHTEPHAERCALLTIDVQQDFVRESGSARIPGTDELLPSMAQIAAAFRERRLPIVHVVRLYLADGSNAELSRRAVVSGDTPVVWPGSDGSQLVAELRPDPAVTLDHELLLRREFQKIGSQEWLMYKPRWGAFFDTGLADHLRHIGVDTVVIVGANFPNCPRTTLYEASERDFRIVLVPDAISRTYPQGIEECAGIGAVIKEKDELLEWLPAASLASAVGNGHR